MLRLAILGVALAGNAAFGQTPAGIAQGPGPAGADTRSLHDPAALRPEAPLPPDAIVPGAAGVEIIICAADAPPVDASGAFGLSAAATAQLGQTVAAREVRVLHPWAATPTMTGAGAEMPVRFFNRGRTLIFDAQSEVLYVERDHRRFTYTRSGKSGVTTWRGICRAAG